MITIISITAVVGIFAMNIIMIGSLVKLITLVIKFVKGKASENDLVEDNFKKIIDILKTTLNSISNLSNRISKNEVNIYNLEKEMKSITDKIFKTEIDIQIINSYMAGVDKKLKENNKNGN